MEGIESTIAIVGVYFALMAVLAICVEAVIGWLKLIPRLGLQGKPSPDDVLKEVQAWLPKPEEGDDAAKKEDWKARIEALQKALKDLKDVKVDENTSLDGVVKAIGEAFEQHIKDERLRRGAIRFLAIALGVGFAAIFQIDSLQLLAPLSESAEEVWLANLGTQGSHLVGLVLSGLAASAGSSFWHDQSARLRNLKKAAQTVGEATGT